ncbi:MAG: NUDIX domain-containing protein [Bacteroidia bacterium]|nr:NUDIX domain-containing protein [Bacteroidia bacterium]
MLYPFSVRVYGIYLDSDKNILISKEKIAGNWYTKFPGGGLEFGEGTLQCLQREFKEEMNLEIEIGPHLYTTDFFCESEFRKGIQVISIYYLINSISNLPQVSEPGIQECELLPIHQINLSYLTFETDQKAFTHLQRILQK